MLDAYKFSMPVITSGNGGLPEIVMNKKTGIILDETNQYTIKNAILDLYENKNMIKNMIKNIEEYLINFKVETQVNEMINIYNEVIKSKEKV